MSTLFEQFLTSSARNLARPAYSYLGKETSYGDVRTAISRLSYLYQRELGASPRVVLLARNAPAWIKTFFALTNIRATIIPLDPDLPLSDWVEAFKETQPTHVAITSDLLNTVRDFMQSERISLPLVEIEKRQGGEYDTSFSAPPDHRPVETDLILMLRSAGHAGKAKWVRLNHLQLFGASSVLKSAYKPLSTDRLHTVLSWAHPFAFVHGFLFPIMSGMCLIIDAGDSAVKSSEHLDFIVKSRVTRMVGTPSYFQKLVNLSKAENRPLAGVKSVTVGLGQLPAQLRQEFHEMKIAAPHVYGMVENVWTISMEGLEELDLEWGVHGKPLSGLRYKVIDDNGDVIEGADRRVGLLAVTGPTVMHSYFGKDHEKDTKNALRGTWLYTGDVTVLDGEGDDLKISFLGRKEDLIKIDGDYTSMEDLDSVLKKIPGLSDVAGFAVKNSKNQIVTVCAVVKNKGSALSEKQIKDICAARLHEDLCPKAVVFTDVIPRDEGQNINYHRLRGQFSGAAG